MVYSFTTAILPFQESIYLQELRRLIDMESIENRDAPARLPHSAIVENSLSFLRPLGWSIFEKAPYGIVIVNALQVICAVNLEVVCQFGYARQQLLGQPLNMLLPESVREQHARYMAQFFRHPMTRAMGQGRKIVGQHSDGTTFSIDVALIFLETDEGIMAAAFIREGPEQHGSG